ncbi:MAG: AzlD domain-containing protein, partial [Saezia sp.]
MNISSAIAEHMDIAVLSVLAMGAITFFLRAFPVLVPRKLLESRYLKALNIAFPISVMTLLILASLGLKLEAPNLIDLSAKLLSLAIVFLSYHYFKN